MVNIWRSQRFPTFATELPKPKATQSTIEPLHQADSSQLPFTQAIPSQSTTQLRRKLTLSLLGELLEQILDVIDRSSHESRDGLEGGFVGRGRMRLGGDELLGPLEGGDELVVVDLVELLVEGDEILLFFLFDVLLEIVPQGLDSRQEVRVVGL